MYYISVQNIVKKRQEDRNDAFFSIKELYKILSKKREDRKKKNVIIFLPAIQLSICT